MLNFWNFNWYKYRKNIFSLTKLIVFCKYKKQNNVMPATHSKKVGTEAKQDKVTSDIVLEGSTIISLTGNTWGYQDHNIKELPPKA